MRRALKFALLLLALFCAPWCILRVITPIYTPQDAPKAEAALIFGAVVRNSEISEFHAQRLDTAVDLIKMGKVSKLVVSNRAHAAGLMRDYLVAQGIPEDAIEMDTLAERTADTCIAEQATHPNRDVVFVSHRFHLPRIALQCQNHGVEGASVARPAFGPETYPIGDIIWYRGGRFLRENVLIWGAILGFYPK